MHSLTLNDPWFNLVKEGIKLYEGRCYWKSVLDFKIDDQVLVSHHTDISKPSFICNIKTILHFTTFKEALEKLGLDSTLPGVKTIDEGVDIYLKFVSLATQIKFGVVMIELIPSGIRFAD